ncbi:MAG: polysaccharide biosynthesis tyrosine autokinase [Flavobacteriales bacterium]|nr:polysaccharide biosynthesis tyrosine autokinase [Flavobacteriales bacterium]
MEHEFDFDDGKSSSNLNIKAELNKYLSKWYWIVFSVLVCYAIGQLYIRYQNPVYSATTKLLIKDATNSKGLQGFDKFMSNPTENIENEVEILKSRKLIEKVITDLNLNLIIKTEGVFRDHDLYKHEPVIITLDSTVDNINLNESFLLKTISPTTYQKLNHDKEVIGTYKYGQKITTEKGSYIINLNKNEKLNKNTIYQVKIATPKNMIGSYLGRLSITPKEETSVLNLSFTDNNIDRAKDFLDELLIQYNNEIINDLNQASENTDKFIKERLSIIANELDLVEKDQEDYKRKNELIDVGVSAGIHAGNKEEINQRIINGETQLKVVNLVHSQIKKNPNDLLPLNMIPYDNSASTLIAEYNQLLLEKNKLLYNSSTPNNPLVENINKKISALKGSIEDNFNNLKSSLRLQLNELKSQESQLQAKVNQLPKQERELREILRQQKVKESLYLYLLQRKEETAISMAIKTSNAKIIDKAYYTGQVAPKTSNIKQMSLLIGLLIPILIIFLIGTLNTKIVAKQDIQSLGIPYLGDIPRSKDNTKILDINSRDTVSEAFRILRTNVDFMLPKKEGIASKIFVTSTISGEGKTFISLNLASVLSLINERVLLIGMDVRNPKIHRYVELTKKYGLTHYLSQNDIELDEIINKGKNFDFINSGIIPPNPSELLASDKMNELFDIAEKKYDYIVVDTAPASLVTDTFVTTKFADLYIYVCRAFYLDKSMLQLAKSYHKEKRLPNMALVLNDSQQERAYKYYGYSYTYSYGYGSNNARKPWWKKIFKKDKSYFTKSNSRKYKY